MFNKTILLITLIFTTVVNAQHQSFGHTPFQTSVANDHVQKLERSAYTVFYNHKYRLPVLSAYHAVKAYRTLPLRKGKFSKFRTDIELQNPVTMEDYKGVFKKHGFAKGHLAPYYISGGDRDHDGLFAKYESASDHDDEQTIFEVNYLSNITPQHHACFNGSGAVWYGFETFIRKNIVDKGQEAWVYAGPIIDTNDEFIGKKKDISVPDRFFKILLQQQGDGQWSALAFIFPHYRKVDGECNDANKDFFDPAHFASVDEIESITGINFFESMPDDQEQMLESMDASVVWECYY